ncbi:trypsin-like peptidase domain-containing protein [Bosea sp. R86505]|uniref:trypsin-like peptidase domain-containing protein n=1 Tax=Bosea sp. R86505 TaxID=3101710 RepID=UPI0036705EB8
MRASNVEFLDDQTKKRRMPITQLESALISRRRALQWMTASAALAGMDGVYMTAMAQPIGGLDAACRPVRTIVRAAREAVVSILVRQPARRDTPDVEPVVDESQFAPKASGFLIRSEGILVTNNHVLAAEGDMRVRLVDGRLFAVKVIGADPVTDLAVLRLHGEGRFPELMLSATLSVEPGDEVYAIGDPFGYRATVTRGIVSSLEQRYSDSDSIGYIQHDAAINPGSSGGPIIDACGQVVGINTAIADESHAFVGIALAIPSPLITTVVSELLEDGQINRGSLGAGFQQLNTELAQGLQVSPPIGLIVSRIKPGSAADQGGLGVGDIVRAINGAPATKLRDLGRHLLLARTGTRLDLSILRGGVASAVTIILGPAESIAGHTRPASFARPKSISGQPQRGQPLAFGADFVADSRSTSASEASVILSQTSDTGAAYRAGLAPGDVIHSVGGHPVTSPEDLLRLWQTLQLPALAMLVSRPPYAAEFVLVPRLDGEGRRQKIGNQATTPSIDY